MHKAQFIAAAIGAIALSFSSGALAGQLVYKPINPSFGGDPFNSAHLLGIANGIDRYKDPDAVDPFSLLNESDPQAELNQQIQQQVTQGVSSNAIDSVLSQNSGTYNIGSSRISITPNPDGRTRQIVLQNVDTGTKTVYDVPLATNPESIILGSEGAQNNTPSGIVPNANASVLPNIDFGTINLPEFDTVGLPGATPVGD